MTNLKTPSSLKNALPHPPIIIDQVPYFLITAARFELTNIRQQMPLFEFKTYSQIRCLERQLHENHKNLNEQYELLSQDSEKGFSRTDVKPLINTFKTACQEDIENTISNLKGRSKWLELFLTRKLLPKLIDPLWEEQLYTTNEKPKEFEIKKNKTVEKIESALFNLLKDIYKLQRQYGKKHQLVCTAHQLHTTLYGYMLDFEQHNDRKIFNQNCQLAIQEALPILETEPRWSTYLTNLLKQLINAFIWTTTFGQCNNFFTIKTEAQKAVESFVNNAESSFDITT